MIINKRILFYVLGGLFCSVTIFYLVFAMIADSKLVAAKLAIKEAGYPTSVSELMSAEISPAENAAILYESANKLLEAEDWSTISKKFYDKKEFSSEELGIISDFLSRKSVESIFSILQQASERKSCQFITNFSDGPGTLMPHISWHINRFLTAAFYAYLNEGQNDKALQTLQLSLNYSSRFMLEPFLISHLVACSYYHIHVSQIKSLTGKNIAVPSDILAAITSHSIQQSLIQALHSERICLVDWVFNPSKYTDTVTGAYLDSDVKGLSFYAMTPFWNLDYAASTRLSLEMINYIQQPYTGKNPELPIASYHVLTAQLFPAYYSCFQTSLELRAELEICKAGLACIDFFKQHQRFPATLAEAGHFIDPLTSKALIYSLNDNGFTISSLGKNLRANDEDAPKWIYIQSK